MLEHGGRLLAAARRYGIAPQDWLDLSTGINPLGYSVPPVPASVWLRLPEEEEEGEEKAGGLEAAARAYYGATRILPVAGSQMAIRSLPRLFAPGRVAVLAPAYAEHAAAWAHAGHRVTPFHDDALEAAAASHDHVVLCNPNNPTGAVFGARALRDAAACLAARGGVLVVDEAFADADPAQSLAAADVPGRVVLRSLGKFFGLAGARVGFVIADAALLERLREEVGPWTVSGPARHVAAVALRDADWQDATRERLRTDAARLHALLRDAGWGESRGTSLFRWIECPDAAERHERLARRGILVRLFGDPASLRFGLPGGEVQWARLADALLRACE